MNISVAIADSNREYVERLSEVLQQYEDLTIYIYTTAQKLTDAMEENRFDVVLFDPDLSENRLVFPNVKLPVCLYSDEARNRDFYPDFAKVVKYQRVSNIYKEFIREYAGKAGYSPDFDHSQNTRMIAVYSPIGGSGKTTVALAIASKISGLGKSVLFLSLEQLNSSISLNPGKEDGIVSLVEGAANEKVNFELRAKSLMKEGLSGMYYIEGFERLVDYDAVTGKEIEDVLTKIRRCGICDVIVIDMESGMDPIGRTVLGLADRIVIVERPGEIPNTKMSLFAQQALVDEHKGKMVKVKNYAENNSVYAGNLSVPEVGIVHNYGNLQLKNILQTIYANNEIAIDKIIDNK